MKYLVLTSLLAVATPSAHADATADAQAHIAKAMEAHAKNDFATALVELETAYSIDPIPDLLYAIGQVHVKLEHCADAIAWYERYLATSPAAQAKVDTQHAIKTCEAKLAPPPPTPASSTATSTQVTATSSAPSPWYKDTLGGALVLTGVALGVAGGVAYVGARGSLDDAEAANSIDDYRGHIDDAIAMRTISVVLFAGGGALVVGGIVRYATRGSSREASTVSAAPAAGGGVVTWGGSF